MKKLHIIISLERDEEGWLGCISGGVKIRKKPEVDPEPTREKALTMAKWWVLDELANIEMQAVEDTNLDLWIEDPGPYDSIIFDVR